jgi:predicted dehydrogenase
MAELAGRPLRLILAGVGQRGKQWAQVAYENPDCRIVAYVEPDAAYRAWAKERFTLPDEVLFDDLDRAFASVEADAVILATPPMVRGEQCIKAIDLGLPIMAEKPLTMRFEETARVTMYARKQRVPLVSGFNFRFLNVTQAARRIITGGELGKPSFARFVYWLHRTGVKPGGNRYPLWMEHPMLLEQSIHHFDLIRYVYDSEVKALRAWEHNPSWSPYREPATALALFEMENGMLVHYFGTWMGQSMVREFEWRTDCERGALFQRQMFSDLAIARAGSDVLEPVPLEPDQAFTDDTRRLLKEFIRGLQAGEEPQPGGLDNLKTMAITCACIDSARASGERIEMAEYYRRYGLSPEDLAQ